MNHALNLPDDGDPNLPPAALNVTYTARNRDRHQSSQPAGPRTKAEHYVVADANRKKRIQAAIALRMSYRIERDAKFAFERTPYQNGIQHCLWCLHGIREAENAETLIYRDRQLAGVIAGAKAFGAIPIADVDKLMTLRESAFNYRRKELLP